MATQINDGLVCSQLVDLDLVTVPWTCPCVHCVMSAESEESAESVETSSVMHGDHDHQHRENCCLAACGLWEMKTVPLKVVKMQPWIVLERDAPLEQSSALPQALAP